MRHAGTQEIETERLILRRLTPEDAGMMYTNWANDPQVTKYLRWEPHKNAEETRELLTAWALLYPNGDYYQWGRKGHRAGVWVHRYFHIQFRRTGARPLARFRPHERRVGSGLLHRQSVVEQRFYHRSSPRSCRILVPEYRQ